MQAGTLHRSPTSHISYGNFRRDEFHYLQAEKLTSVVVENELECIFRCVEETKCYSLNLAVYPDSKGLHLCELLATDKYKAAKHFLANDTFHHHRPGVSNIGRANLRVNLRIQLKRDFSSFYSLHAKALLVRTVLAVLLTMNWTPISVTVNLDFSELTANEEVFWKVIVFSAVYCGICIIRCQSYT